MKFKLNEYKQGVAEEELIEDVKRVHAIVGDQYLSISLYEKHGKYSESTFRYRFGSWVALLKKLGLRTERNSNEMKRISDDALIEDLLSVSKKLEKKRITSSEYIELGKYSLPTIKERFETWAKFVQKAGLDNTGYIKRVDTIELFNELEHIWTSLGKQPTTTDMKKGISKYSLDTFTRRFGGWRNTLKAFIDYINEDNEEIIEEGTEIDENLINLSSQKNEGANEDNIRIKIKRTPRNINLRLRFKVLSRDNFTCCYCGASPAKDPNVELHVDHILPWSEGGETIIENLQTSCSNCNLGKSNMKHT